MTYTLAFHGAAGSVTGSCFALARGPDVVLVDCGLFQGTKSLRALNYAALPFDPKAVRAVLLTHAHIDHSGLLPRLAAAGATPPVHATAATGDLLGVMLPDTAHIQEVEVRRLNRRNRRRGRSTVTPIYTKADARAVLKAVRAAGYGAWVRVTDWLSARFWNAGHILGSASIEVALGPDPDAPEIRLLFSGDLGPDDKSFHAPPDGPAGLDLIVMETTYGARERPAPDAAARQTLLAREIDRALERGGPILMPIFAVERTQEILFDLDHLFDTGRLPAMPVFLDSPLAIRATEVFDSHLPEVNQPGTPHPFRRANLHPLEHARDSRRLERLRGAAIVMAGSGMCDAGRIREHLADHLWRDEATVLLVGYQAPGTLGRVLLEGRQAVRIHGREVSVRAAVRVLDVYSGHADRRGLLAWAKARGAPRHGLFLVHGEEAARRALGDGLIEGGLAPDLIHMPGLDARFRLKPGRRPQALPKDGRRVAPDALGPADWHNRYADLVLGLSRSLREAPDDAARKALIDRLEAVLKAD